MVIFYAIKCAIECMSHWHPKITMQILNNTNKFNKSQRTPACVWPWIKLIGSSFCCRRRFTFYHNLLFFRVIYVIRVYCIRNMKVRGCTKEEAEEDEKNMKEFKFVIIIVTHHRTKIQLQNYIFITYLHLGLSFF